MYDIKVIYVAAVTVRKTSVPAPFPFVGRAARQVKHRFTYVLAEVETKKWPWSTPVKDCEVFTHHSVPNTWSYTDTMIAVRRSVAKSLTACLRGYMAGYGDGKDAK